LKKTIVLLLSFLALSLMAQSPLPSGQYEPWKSWVQEADAQARAAKQKASALRLSETLAQRDASLKALREAWVRLGPCKEVMPYAERAHADALRYWSQVSWSGQDDEIDAAREVWRDVASLCNSLQTLQTKP
jgi:hypothetical protein